MIAHRFFISSMPRHGCGVALRRRRALVVVAVLALALPPVSAGATGTWVEEAKLTASDVAEQDFFGIWVAFSGDTALVGASDADVGGNPDQGAAYVFVRNDGIWTEQAKLTATDSTGNRGRAPYTCQVCEAGTSVCSEEVTLRFGGPPPYPRLAADGAGECPDPRRRPEKGGHFLARGVHAYTDSAALNREEGAMVEGDRWILDAQDCSPVSRRDSLEFRASRPIAADVILDILSRAAVPNSTGDLSVVPALPEAAAGIHLPACAVDAENLPACISGTERLGS